MPRVRGRGEGTVRLRADGRWEARLRLSKGRQRSYFGATKREVQVKLRAAMRDRDRGTLVTGSRQTVGQFVQGWLRDIAEGRVRPQTFKRYRELCVKHIIPGVGDLLLERLTPQDVQAMLNAKTKEGLSPRTVNHIRAVLRNALHQALKWGAVARNVAELVDPPRIPEVERRTLNVDEAARFLEAVQTDPLAAAHIAGLSLGMRIGEVLGLKWEDIDFDRATVSVRRSLQRDHGQLMLGELKTESSRRTLPMPTVAADALLAHRACQRQARVQPGPPWQGLVFASEKGMPLEGTNVLRSLQRTLAAAGLPRIRFHDLRHSCASLLFAQGVEPKTVQTILGHSRIGTTLDVYTHIAASERAVSSVLRDAATTMNRLLGRASS